LLIVNKLTEQIARAAQKALSHTLNGNFRKEPRKYPTFWLRSGGRDNYAIYLA
jgi:hypothetical protein